MTMIYEARCTKCGETFNPGDETDLEHCQKNDGSPCGGQGEMLGVWGPPVVVARIPARDLRPVHVDLELHLLRPGDVFEGGGGAHRESIRIDEVDLVEDGTRVRYTGKCRGSRGKAVAWSGFVDEKVYVTERGPGATFEELDAGIMFDPQGQVILSESAPRPGELVDEDLYQAFLDRQVARLR